MSPDDICLERATLDAFDEVKQLDDRAFANGHGIDDTELRHIFDNGFVLVARDAAGTMIAESQMLLAPIPELPYPFAHPVAYCCGTGVHPQHQGRGLGKRLALEKERIATEEHGATEFHLTVSVENRASLRLWHKLGYRSFRYDPTFYGDDPARDARLIFYKRAGWPQVTEHPSYMTAVPVAFDNGYDPETHECIRRLLDEGREGVWVDEQYMYFR